jgi:MFS family permease
MICNAIGSIVLGHMADRAAAALDTALIRICLLRMILIAMLLPPVAHALGFLYVTVVFAALGLVAGGTVPLVLKCTKRLYTADLIGVGASVNTTAAGIFAGASQPVIGFAMVAVSQFAGSGVEHGPASVSDAGYGALIGILLLMSLPGIAGPLLMRTPITGNCGSRSTSLRGWTRAVAGRDPGTDRSPDVGIFVRRLADLCRVQYARACDAAKPPVQHIHADVPAAMGIRKDPWNGEGGSRRVR